MYISQKTIDFIISQEVTSETVYNKKYATPEWPGGDSGITIGIGYDLGYNTADRIAKDWNMLPPQHLQLLKSVAGIKGTAARDRLKQTPSLKTVVVPFSTAKQVFVNNTIPRFAKQTLTIYPGLADLEPDAAGALISMVYNRGASLSGDRRKEMRDIVPLVAKKDYSGIAQLIDASKHLWEGKNLDGLIRRREKEAELVRNAVRTYAATEKIPVNIA
jgi:GH24 family phage-related lysozyme (muramidase)